MKFLLLISLLFSITANAADTIYCTIDGARVDALQPTKGYPYNPECEPALWQGDACYTGSRTRIIERLNVEGDDRVGSDEEWIENARYAGRDLRYTVVQGPISESDSYTIQKCENTSRRSTLREQLPLFPDLELQQDIVELQAYLNLSDTTAEWDLLTYKVSDLESTVDAVVRGYEEDEREYVIDGNAASELAYWMETYRGTPESVEEDFEPLMERMVEKNVILKVISAGPPESCDESEYCTWMIFEVFLSNGERYFIHFDFTT